MAFGIYKQGQGYWVRVMTAAFAGVLIIAAAAWAWQQAGIVRLPAREWNFSISNVRGEAQPGDTITFHYYNPNAPDTLVELGAATIDAYDPGKGSTATIRVSNFSNEELREQANDAVRITAADSPAALPGVQDTPGNDLDNGDSGFTAQIRGSTPTPIFPVEYLQSGAAGAMMLLGAICLYIFVGTKKSTVEFLVATDGEMKKVNWTSYREVKGSTIVVITATFLIAGFLFLVDTAFSWVFSEIGVLQR
ncbi:MAG: preprotein translocase subunit SecE [Phycisphaerales bacterium]